MIPSWRQIIDDQNERRAEALSLFARAERARKRLFAVARFWLTLAVCLVVFVAFTFFVG